MRKTANDSFKSKVKVVNRGIVLEYVFPRVRKVRANRKWDREAFLDAGEATFGEHTRVTLTS